jgi:PKD repeat protein
VTFDGSASFDPDGSIRSFEWDVDGDGTVDATGETVEHVYATPGTFDVTLTVTDDDGRTGSRTRTVEVSAR